MTSKRATWRAAIRPRVLQERGRERVVAGRHADAGGTGRGVDRGEVLVEEAGRADHDGHAPFQCERDVTPDHDRVRVVDEHVRAAIERCLDVAHDRYSESIAAKGLADVATDLASCDRRLQAQVIGRRDRRDQLASDRAEGAGHADGEGCGRDGTAQ
jgi:hypothetical protein